MIAEQSEEIEDALVQLAQHGTPGTAPVGLFDVGSSEFIQFFEASVLRETVMTGGATCRFFEGAYGYGKTHLLRMIAEVSRQHGLAVVSTELTTDLRLESWDSITRYILQRIEYQTEEGPVYGLAHILNWIGRTASSDLYTFLQTHMPHPGFKKAMEYAVRVDVLPQELVRFLDGERVRTLSLRNAGCAGVRDPLSARNAEAVLQTLTRGLVALGLPGVALLFDETDQSFRAKTAAAVNKVQNGANLMRRMVDACSTGRLNGIVSVFAVLPGFIEQCSFTYPALGQRLDREFRMDRAEPWRSPVISVESVSTVRGPNAFVRALSARLAELVKMCGASVNGLESDLVALGDSIVNEQAGGEYRRLVTRSLAMKAVDRLEAL